MKKILVSLFIILALSIGMVMPSHSAPLVTANCWELTGGGTRALDSFPVNTIKDKDRAFVLTSTDEFYYFEFQADATDAENTSTHPYRVRPDDYTTKGVWYEQSLVGYFSSDVLVDNSDLDVTDGSNSVFSVDSVNEIVTIGTGGGKVDLLRVEGNAVIGKNYAGTYAGAVNGLIVEGKVGLGDTNPAYRFVVKGNDAGILLYRTGGSEPFILLGDGNNSHGGQIRGSVSTSGFRFTNFTGTTTFLGVTKNVGIGTMTFDGTADKVFQITGSTEPGGSVADSVQYYEKDSSQGAGHGTLGFYTEETVEAIGTFTAANKLRIWINGVEYWIQLDPV